MKVVMIPSADGGIGHISRSSILGRKLIEIDPSIEIELLLDTDRLRPFNIKAAESSGFPVKLFPHRPRAERTAIVRQFLGKANIIIDDTTRYLIPFRKLVPGVPWISIPLFPIGDELFLDWPFLVQTELIIWAYSSLMDFPEELAMFNPKLIQTGPFLDLIDKPNKKEARRQLSLNPNEEIIVYAPRGMPFGVEFGSRVLGSIFLAVEKLREAGKAARLVLLAVNNPEELRVPGVPFPLPEWVTVKGVLSQAESMRYLTAASLTVTEGTSTTHEAAALKTPFVMVPGPIQETLRLGRNLAQRSGAAVLVDQAVNGDKMLESFNFILNNSTEHQARVEQAHRLVTGGGGVEAAARKVLEVAARFKFSA